MRLRSSNSRVYTHVPWTAGGGMHVQQPRGVGALHRARVPVIHVEKLGEVRGPQRAVLVVGPQPVLPAGELGPAGGERAERGHRFSMVSIFE